MCYSSVFEAREDFVLPVSIPYRHRLGEAKDHGKKEKKNSPSLWHDELAVCRGNRCYTKWAFSVRGTVWRIEMGWKILWQKKMRWMHFVLFCLFSSCAARPVSLASPNLLLPWGSVPVSVSGLSSSEMLRCFIVLLSSFCKCKRLLIFLGLFSFVRKRTWIKLSMHDIY